MQIMPAEQQPSNITNRWTLHRYFHGLHRRYLTETDTSVKCYDLLISRIVAIALWLYVFIIEFITYSTVIKYPNRALHFLFAANYPVKDISSIIYASGAATYGMSIEVYFLLLFAVANGILAVINCGINHSAATASIIYIFKTIVLFMGTELSYQNFKRFKFNQSYKLHNETATRAMLRQSVYLTVTIIFLVSPGLRAVYSGVRFKCPYKNTSTNGSHCHIIDFSQRIFEDNDKCVSDYTSMITGMEQMRIIRNIALCSIGFYSMYNKAFLDTTGTSTVIHKIMLIVFIIMSSSFITANIDPFYYHQIKLYFNLIEIIIFIILMVLLILNLRKKCEHRKYTIMEKNPTIFG